MEVFEIVNLYNNVKNTLYYVLQFSRPLSTMLSAYREYILQLYTKEGEMIKEFAIASLEDPTKELTEELIEFLFTLHGRRNR